MSKITFEITGKPIPWRRAGRNGSRCFDTQRKEKQHFKEQILPRIRDYKSNGEELLDLEKSADKALRVWIEFRMEIPKSISQDEKEERNNYSHTFKPDVDNMVKFVCDALNGVLWYDDSQIAELHTRKIWSYDPKTLICIEEIDEI